MAEVTNESIHEVLKAVLARPGSAQVGVCEVRALRRTVHGVREDLHDRHEAFSAPDLRVARIERRLDIVDTPVS